MTASLSRDEIKDEAQRMGFNMVGVAPAVTPDGYSRYLQWLERGQHAGMDYLRRQAPIRRHPDQLLGSARSVIMVGMVYGWPGREQPTAEDDSPRIARYARGGDYHELFWRRLETLLDWIQRRVPGCKGRSLCDSAPLLEREFARLAGLGWFGKNTMLIHKKLGSFTLLGALVVDIEIEPDQPFEFNHCGTCTRCLDACPTQAFPQPGVLDAQRCLSYWTIEHRGPIPAEIAESLNGWVFGCDICQEVCPWNRKASTTSEPSLAAREPWESPDLAAWLTMEPAEFQKLIHGTALARAKRGGLLRNAVLVLGARGDRADLPALLRAAEDRDPIVRCAAAWALSRFDDPLAREMLEKLAADPDPEVRSRLVSESSPALAESTGEDLLPLKVQD